MAAMRALVHSGRRNIYDRMRVGLNCGKDGMAESVGVVVKSDARVERSKDRMAVTNDRDPASSGRSSCFVPSTLGVLAELGKSWRTSNAAFLFFSFL
jgi:hypothetical protein